MELKVGTRYWWGNASKHHGWYDEIIADKGDGTYLVKNIHYPEIYTYDKAYILHRIEKYGKVSNWVVKYINPK